MCDSNNLEKPPKINKGPLLGIRHVQIFLCFWLLLSSYSVRSCMSIAIVAMTDIDASPNIDVPVYQDVEDYKGIILSSFYWSYVIPQILAGYIIKKYGPKWIIATAMTINGASCALIPLFAEKFGPGGIIVCRVLQGLSQGFVFPSSHYMLGYWAPVDERAVLSTATYIGVEVGVVMCFPLTGYISGSWAGWPVAFYVMAGIGLAWVVAWVLFGCNRPCDHSRITQAERKYIEVSLGHEVQEELRTPWKAILTSAPFWALVMAETSLGWTVATFTNETPSYLHHALDYDIESNGVVSMLPSLTVIIMSFFYAFLGDWLVAKRKWAIVKVRKTLHPVGVVPSCFGLIALAFVPKGHPEVSVFLLVASLGFMSALVSASNVNHMDLSPRFAGILMGITNSISMITGIVSPLMVQYVVTDMSDVSLWRIIFLTSAGIAFTSTVIFVTFGSGSVQWWNDGADARCKVNSKDEENKIQHTDK